MAEDAKVETSVPTFISDLFRSGNYSDFTLESHGKEFRLHKAIVCPQSPVIATALNGNFKESKTSHIKVDDSVSLQTVQYMLEFLYTGKYQVKANGSNTMVQPSASTTTAKVDATPISTSRTNTPPSTSTTSNTKLSPPEPEQKSRFLSHCNVYSIGDYYDIPKLKSQALEKLQLLLLECWKRDTFLTTADEILRSTSEDAIVDLLVTATVSHINSLLKYTNLEPLEVHGAFLLKVLKSYHTQSGGPMSQAKQLLSRARECHQKLNATYSCPKCRRLFGGKILTTGESPLPTTFYVKCKCGQIVP